MPITRVRAWIRALLFRRRIESEMDKEMRLHLELETEANIRAGMPPDMARWQAALAFRGVDRFKEDVRDALGTRLIEESWRDLRYAVRLARRSPSFTVTALALLILAVGTASAIFSVVYAVLVRPLPYPQPERLVFISDGGFGIAWPDYQDWRARASVFDGLASSVADAVVVTGGEAPRRFESRNVTANFFRVLRVPAFKGRLFGEDDARPDASSTAVVSYEFWMRELGGSATVIGKELLLSRGSFTIIGVLPPGFRYMTPANVYLLLEPQVARNDYRGMQSRANHTTLFAVGRLKPDITLQAAQAEMHTIAVALMQEYPATNKGANLPVVPLVDQIVGTTAPTLTVLGGAVTLLLLIACINLASLLLNRSAARAHEFSVRAAIGGSRQRLVRQILIEQALFVLVGGALGAFAGAGMLRGLVSAMPSDLPRLDEIHLDVAVLALTTLFGCACALAFGLGPALKASGINRGELALRSGQRSTRATSSLRRTLMVAEIAVATVLLFGAGLMVHTMVRLARVDPGFDPRNLQTFALSFAAPKWGGPEGDVRKLVFLDAVVQRLRAVPGVENVALTYTLPTMGSNWWSQFLILDKPAPAPGDFGPNAGMVPVSAGYFATLRIPLLKGRVFDRSDTPKSLPVIVINNSLARKYWPGEDPIGKQVRGGSPGNEYGPWRTIVGVVGDTKQHGVDQEAPPQVFMPTVQEPRSPLFVIARVGSAQPTTLEGIVHDLDRSVVVYNDRTLDQVMREASSRRRFAMIVLSVFGAVAVLLAAIGLYGVIAQSVTERRNEIGIRMSLGATQRQVVRMFLQRGMLAAFFGLAFGLVVAATAARSLQSMVFGLTTNDPLTIGAVTAILASVALAACYVPARSAARVDPVRALRME